MLHNEGFIPRSHTLKKRELEKILRPEHRYVKDTGSGTFAVLMACFGLFLEYNIIMTAINSTTSVDRFNWIIFSIFPTGILTLGALIWAAAVVYDVVDVVT